MVPTAAKFSPKLEGQRMEERFTFYSVFSRMFKRVT